MDFAEQLNFAFILAIPIACVVWTVTQEELFREMRESLAGYQRRMKDSLIRRKLAYLPTCPYCFSHYVAALFVFLYDFRMLTADWRGYVVSLFTLVLFSNIYLSAYNLLRVLLRRNKAAADLLEAEAKQLSNHGLPNTAVNGHDHSKRRQTAYGNGTTLRFPDHAVGG